MIQDLAQTLEALYNRYRVLNTGKVATYIPELAKADPDSFCIAVTMVDGTRHVVGDAECAFTLQSISKPLVFGHALTTVGRNIVIDLTGVEPTGRSFSSMVGLDEIGRPLNPMVNAGAIVTTSLLPGRTASERYQGLRAAIAHYTGELPELDQAVYESEKRTGDRNRALGYLLKDKGTIEGDIDEHLELYFKSCSPLTNTPQLANTAATLANFGVNPVTGHRALDETYIKDLLVVMLMNGMYNYAGRWAYEVGIPAKSGVSGGLMGVIPGVMGIAVYSPRLDEYGNSTRGLAACRELVEKYKLHIFDQNMLPWKR